MAYAPNTYSSTWMLVRPYDHIRSLGNDDISMVVRLWFGLDAFDTPLIFCCSCNKSIAHDPWHCLSCTAEARTGFIQTSTRRYSHRLEESLQAVWHRHG